jgi:hypothetical protein
MEEPKSEQTHGVEKGTPVIEPSVGKDEFYIDPTKEVKLLAKLDLVFTPVIMLLYISCFLDRSNIGIWSYLYVLERSNEDGFSASQFLRHCSLSIILLAYVKFCFSGEEGNRKVEPIKGCVPDLDHHLRTLQYYHSLMC